jgi:hypothetical protein
LSPIHRKIRVKFRISKGNPVQIEPSLDTEVASAAALSERTEANSMTITGTHSGPVSGKTHLHLLRESAAARNLRWATPPAAGPRDMIAGAAGDRDFDIAAAIGPYRGDADDVTREAASGR